MQKVIITYKLADGVALDEYRKWSLEVDQRITAYEPSIARCEPHVVDSVDPAGTVIHIFEDIDIDSWDAYQEMSRTSEPMKIVMEGFNRLVDLDSVVTICGSRIKSARPSRARRMRPAGCSSLWRSLWSVPGASALEQR